MTKLFILFFTLLSTVSYAVERDSMHYAKKRYPDKGWNSFQQELGISAGPYFLTINHEPTSPRIKQGLGAITGIAYNLEGKKFYSSLESHFAFVATGDNFTNDLYASDLNLILNIQGKGGYKFPMLGKTQLYAGGILYINIHNYMFPEAYNGMLQYVNAIMLGVHFKVEQPVHFFFNSLKQHSPFYVSWDFSIPYMGVITTPPYNGFYDFTIPEREISDDMVSEAAGLGNTVILDSKLNFDWHLRNSNTVRLSYEWNYSAFNPEIGKMQFASHALRLALLVKLDRNSHKTRLKHYGY